jgi:ppGpp synthetase/RelA/SpoT-type nucleotidyltranferase
MNYLCSEWQGETAYIKHNPINELEFKNKSTSALNKQFKLLGQTFVDSTDDQAAAKKWYPETIEHGEKRVKKAASLFKKLVKEQKKKTVCHIVVCHGL